MTISTVVMDGQRTWCQCGAERPELGDASQSFDQNKVPVRLLPLPTHTPGVPRDYISKMKTPLSPSLWAKNYHLANKQVEEVFRSGWSQNSNMEMRSPTCSSTVHTHYEERRLSHIIAQHVLGVYSLNRKPPVHKSAATWETPVWIK